MVLGAKLIKQLGIKICETSRETLCTKLCCLVLLSIFLTSCTKLSEEEAALAQFTDKYVQSIEKEYGFDLFAQGCSMPEKIEWITVMFITDAPENVEGARRIVVPIVLQLIQDMNNDINLRPHLAEYPATLKNVKLTIIFQKQWEGRDNPNRYINSVMVIGRKGTIYYDLYNEKCTMLVDYYQEPFEVAEQILEQEAKQQVP